MFKINLNIFQLGKKFKRNDKEVIFDPIRKILVPFTPEEEVRQKFIRYLIEHLKVPQEMMEVEVAMAHFIKGARGRADIVGYYNVNGKKEPLFIVECKKPDTNITERTIDQLTKYDCIVKSKGYLLITNGNLLYFLIASKDEEIKKLEEILNYEKMIIAQNLKTTRLKTYMDWRRPKFNDLLSKENLNELLKNKGWIGEGTSQTKYKLFANLIGLLMDSSEKFELPINHKTFSIVDQGLRFTDFGNVAGGTWSGEFRYFIIKDSSGNNQILSFSLIGEMMVRNDPIFGNRKGHTKLIIAIDNFEKSHNSLQLDLDDNIEISASSFSIYHDGKLTSGKNGSISKFKVVDYIRKKAPHLVKGNSIYLGTLPTNRNIEWNDAKEFILNGIEYALLRDEIRTNRK